MAPTLQNAEKRAIGFGRRLPQCSGRSLSYAFYSVAVISLLTGATLMLQPYYDRTSTGWLFSMRDGASPHSYKENNIARMRQGSTVEGSGARMRLGGPIYGEGKGPAKYLQQGSGSVGTRYSNNGEIPFGIPRPGPAELPLRATFPQHAMIRDAPHADESGAVSPPSQDAIHKSPPAH